MQVRYQLIWQQVSTQTSQKWFAIAHGKGEGGSKLQKEAEKSATCPQPELLANNKKLVAEKPEDSASIL